MNYITLQNLEHTSNTNTVIVTDSISKKQYFQDSEVIGWCLLNQDGNIKLYHVYQRGVDAQTGRWINEPGLLINEPLPKHDIQNEIQTMFSEIALRGITQPTV